MANENNGSTTLADAVEKKKKEMKEKMSNKTTATILGIFVIVAMLGTIVAIWRVALVGFC